MPGVVMLCGNCGHAKIKRNYRLPDPTKVAYRDVYLCRLCDLTGEKPLKQ